jgi:predicted ABC-type ATPase
VAESNEAKPRVVVIAGPKGAGKSTVAATVLPAVGIRHFVNADVIARGLSAFAPETVALDAGRVMLARLGDLAARGESFAFETTLGSRTHARRLSALKAAGYSVELLYVWLPSVELAVSRVASRVQSGGHDIPEETVRRRYARSAGNLLSLYLPICDRSELFDNSHPSEPRPIASGGAGTGIIVADAVAWEQLGGAARHGAQTD